MSPFGWKKDKAYKTAARLLADGNVESAIEQLRAIIKEDPEHNKAMVTLAVALFEVQENLSLASSETQEALSLLEKAKQIDPKDITPLYNLGVCQRKLGLKEEAIETFQSVLKIEKRHTLSTLHIAEIYYELKNWAKAVEYARVALFRDPGIEGALFWVRDAIEQAALEGIDLNLADEKLSPDN